MDLENEIGKARLFFLHWALQRDSNRVLENLITDSSSSSSYGGPSGPPLGGSYAFLIGEFLEAEAEIMTDVAVGTIAGSAYFYRLDHIIDDDYDECIGKFQRRQLWPHMTLLYGKMIESFLSVLSSDQSEFWHYHRKYMDEWAWSQNRNFTGHEPTDKEIAIGHSAPLKLCGAVLAIATGRKAMIPIIEEGLGAFILGFQIFDDVIDLKKDIKKGKVSYLLSKSGYPKEKYRKEIYRRAIPSLRKAVMDLEEAKKIFRGSFGEHIDGILKTEQAIAAWLHDEAKSSLDDRIIDAIAYS